MRWYSHPPNSVWISGILLNILFRRMESSSAARLTLLISLNVLLKPADAELSTTACKPTYNRRGIHWKWGLTNICRWKLQSTMSIQPQSHHLDCGRQLITNRHPGSASLLIRCIPINFPREDHDPKASNAAPLLCCQLIHKFMICIRTFKRKFPTAEKPVLIFLPDRRRCKSKRSQITIWIWFPVRVTLPDAGVSRCGKPFLVSPGEVE